MSRRLWCQASAWEVKGPSLAPRSLVSHHQPSPGVWAAWKESPPVCLPVCAFPGDSRRGSLLQTLQGLPSSFDKASTLPSPACRPYAAPRSPCAQPAGSTTFTHPPKAPGSFSPVPLATPSVGHKTPLAWLTPPHQKSGRHCPSTSQTWCPVCIIRLFI